MTSYLLRARNGHCSVCGGPEVRRYVLHVSTDGGFEVREADVHNAICLPCIKAGLGQLRRAVRAIERRLVRTSDV